DLTVAALLLATRHVSVTWLVAGAGALRILGIAWTMAVSPVHEIQDASRTVIDDLGLADQPEAVALWEQVTADERSRAPSDRRWTVAFIVTLFAIHLARMQPDGSLLGFVAPAVAVIGDVLLAVLVVLLVVVPVVVSLRGSTRWLERLVWRWYLPMGRAAHGWRRRLLSAWLRYRLRVGIRLREARFSLPAAFSRSLATGLPVAAVIAATVPVWGMSWFFDTENWASGIWNSWAEARTDQWREAMVNAVTAGAQDDQSKTFAIEPPGTKSGD